MALVYDPKDPYVHYALGLAYGRKGEQNKSIESFAAARDHFRKMLEINPSMDEAEFAKKNVASIDAALKNR